MPYIFRPPTVLEGPIGHQRLFQFYKQPRGITVVYDAGEFSEVRYPSEDLLNAVDSYWIGGNEYEVSDEMAALMTAAGYEDNLEPL